MELEKLTALQLGEKIKQRQVSVLDGVKTVFEQIEKLDSEVHAYLDTYKEEAYKRAEEVQKGIEDGTYTSPLAGVPIAIKDNICINGKKTTCASKILENFVPQYNAEVIDRLEKAGLVIIGKTNMDEFAMGSTTETSAYGITRNPWNLEHVPGGSSGGSCAAVAAGETYLALGSDTGGSIRQPSSYCGVTGIKPTYGTVSRYGLVAYASSLDQIGPVGKDVSDCAALLEIIAGHDTKDSTSMKREDLQFSKELTGDIKGMKFGVPEEYLAEGLDPEVKASFMGVLDMLKELGAEVEFFSIKTMEYMIPAYYIIASAEASSNLERFDGVKYGFRAAEYEGLHDMYKKTRTAGFGEEVKRRIMLGSFVLSSGYYDAYYLKALRTKALIKKEFDQAFGKYDVVHFHAEGPCAMLWLPKLFGKRCVATIHGLDHQRAKWGKLASTYIMMGEKCAVKHADEIIVLSKGVQDYFREKYGRETRFIPNGVNRPVIREANIIKYKFGLEKDDYILYLGR